MSTIWAWDVASSTTRCGLDRRKQTQLVAHLTLGTPTIIHQGDESDDIGKEPLRFHGGRTGRLDNRPCFKGSKWQVAVQTSPNLAPDVLSRSHE